MIQFNRQFDPHKIKLLVFDLDGTLIDSRLDLIHSVNAMVRHYERPELPGDVVASYVGDGAPMLVRRALGDPKHEKLVKEALDYFLGYYRVHKLDNTHAYDGVRASLAAIRDSNSVVREMAILSNKPVHPREPLWRRWDCPSSSCTFMVGTAFPPKSLIRKGCASCCMRPKHTRRTR